MSVSDPHPATAVEMAAVRLDTLPEGYFQVVYRGASYHAVKTCHAGGRSVALVARGGRDGTDYISLKFYRLASGIGLLKPCEMPQAKVLAFLAGLRLVQADGDPRATPGRALP